MPQASWQTIGSQPSDAPWALSPTYRTWSSHQTTQNRIKQQQQIKNVFLSGWKASVLECALIRLGCVIKWWSRFSCHVATDKTRFFLNLYYQPLQNAAFSNEIKGGRPLNDISSYNKGKTLFFLLLPKATNKLTKKKTDDIEHYEDLLLAVVNTIVVVVERRGSSIPCLLCHCFLIHVFLHLKSPSFCSKFHASGVSCAENTRPSTKSWSQFKLSFTKQLKSV